MGGLEQIPELGETLSSDSEKKLSCESSEDDSCAGDLWKCIPHPACQTKLKLVRIRNNTDSDNQDNSVYVNGDSGQESSEIWDCYQCPGPGLRLRFVRRRPNCEIRGILKQYNSASKNLRVQFFDQVRIQTFSQYLRTIAQKSRDDLQNCSSLPKPFLLRNVVRVLASSSSKVWMDNE